MPRPASNMATIDMSEDDVPEVQMHESAAHDAEAAEGKSTPENVVKLSAAVEGAEDNMNPSGEPVARPEELRLLEALLFASAEPLDERMLAKKMPDGVDVKAALNQLKSESWHYNFVVGYVDLIECVETGSVMWVWETPRRHTAGRPYRDDAVQFASDLVHEACHSFQYTSYHEQHPKEDVPELVYSQHDAEEACLNYQTDYLRRIGEKERADGYNDAMATEWWKVDTKDMTY